MKPILYLTSEGTLINLNRITVIVKRDGGPSKFAIMFNDYIVDSYETPILRDAAWYELIKRFGCGI